MIAAEAASASDRVLSTAKAVTLSAAMPALAAACLNMCTAVGLRSVPVTVQVGFAFSTGSSEEPQPQPISRKC